MSDVTGSSEIYVRKLTDGKLGEATRVSTSGGLQPRWAHDGRELFFVSAPQGYLSAQMMAVPVTTGGVSFEFGTAAALFNAHMLPTQNVIRDYDVSSDGQRFLIGTAVGDTKATPVTVVLNWTAGLKK